MRKQIKRLIEVSVVALALVVGAGILTTGCVTDKTVAQQKAELVPGQTLRDLGRQFRETGDRYNALIVAKKIEPTEYNEFVTWALRFQELYPSALRAYEGAVSAATRDEAVNAILKLKSELLTYIAFADKRR